VHLAALCPRIDSIHASSGRRLGTSWPRTRDSEPQPHRGVYFTPTSRATPPQLSYAPARHREQCRKWRPLLRPCLREDAHKGLQVADLTRGIVACVKHGSHSRSTGARSLAFEPTGSSRQQTVTPLLDVSSREKG